MRHLCIALGLLGGLSLWAVGTAPAAAQEDTPRVLEIEYVPTARAQIAIWLERDDGTYMQALGLTQATAYRGIGNRPGASQMNSGYLWPYGRREGVLPVWANRRASAPGAEPFRRVIFQDRRAEGLASRTANDFSRDEYFCLSFRQDASSRDALDAVTCPSIFNSDKGRYITEEDVAAGYAEPFQTAPGVEEMRPLDLWSLYPPRRDVSSCGDGPGCYDHPDIDRFAEDARRAMPEIDAVTMATPPAMVPQTLAFTVPEGWEDGEYVLWIEVNTEGDYNDAWGPDQYPTPTGPSGMWDSWAINYGYPFRGQPSVVYRVPFTLSRGVDVQASTDPWGYGSIDGLDGGEVTPMDGSITDDPTAAPGSGADRLHPTDEGWRVRVTVVGPEVCDENVPPGAVESLELSEYHERKDAHRYAHLSFVAPSDDQQITRYEVRFSREPIVDATTWERALPARAATLESEALQVPTGVPAGGIVDVDVGGLTPETTYYFAVRAVDRCNAASEMTVVEYTTPAIEFTTVSPCFVATAAWGTPLAAEIGALRRLRDRHLRTNAIGRALVSAYEVVGPHAADVIRENETLRSATRTVLSPIVALARWLD